MALPTFQYVVVSMESGFARVELNRPEKRNALLPEMLFELGEAVAIVSRRSDIKCVIISGRGSHFCAGMDVSARPIGEDTKHDWVNKRESLVTLSKIADAPVVTVCKLDGFVVGAGLLIAAACKLRYATPDATFYVPELDMGIPFSLGGIAILSRYIGTTRTAEMVLTCNRIVADSPFMNGFVTRVVARDDIDRFVDDAAGAIAKRPNALLLATLSTLREAERALLPDAASDLFTMLFANVEEEASSLRRRYSMRFAARS